MGSLRCWEAKELLQGHTGSTGELVSLLPQALIETTVLYQYDGFNGFKKERSGNKMNGLLMQ